MKNIIVGTAGHIDHGKTALVRALTGIDTDRLEEEKRRGISIDIGFAHLMLTPEVRLGFVDVPGHERFVKNMLAGVGGIDMVLLVVAADESIKPQTREHFDICRLLAIPRGMVVLTKTDLVDPELVELVTLEVEEFVAGTFLAGAPIVGVSAKTGAGLDELKARLAEMARTVAVKDAGRLFRLPIDRAFSLRGFGTVVTGTLIAGAVGVEDEVELFPERRRVRVRGLQAHGEGVARARAGQRTAVNVAGVEPGEISRGMTLAAPGVFEATRMVDCRFDLLPGAKPLKHRAPVHFHAGTAEIEAEARLFEGGVTLAPGTSGWVRFVLRDAALLLPGDRFIVRMFSPVVTIGGGTVVDIAPPRRETEARLRELFEGTAAGRVARLVREAPFGLSEEQLTARLGERPPREGEWVAIAEPRVWFLDRAWLEATLDRWRELLKAFHREHPLAPGMAKEELRSRELPEAPPFLLDALLARTKLIVAEGEVVRLSAHKLALKGDEEEALKKIESAFEQAGLATPAVGEVLARSGVEPARARGLMQILLRERKLVRVGEELAFHGTALAALRALLAARKGQRFGVGEFKEWTGISRKYAIPLLEYLDRERVTRREGDARVVL